MIGVATADTGTVSFPSAHQTAQVAEDYINKDLGGVRGHPLQLVFCDMKNDPTAAQACGQQFANDSSMPMGIVTLVVNGGPFYSAMNAAGKPVLGGYGITPADNTPSDTYFYYAGATFYQALAKWIQAQGNIHTVAYFHGGDAASEGGATTFKGALPSSIKVNEQVVAVGATDLTPQIEAAHVSSADLVVELGINTCGPFTQALSSLGIKPKMVVSLTSCVTPAQIKSAPATYQNWLLLNPSKIPGADPNDADTKLLDAQWTKYGPGGAIGPYAETGWGLVMTLRNILDALPAGALTSSEINTALAGFKGPVVMGPTTISCPGTAPTQTTCTNSLQFYSVTSTGSLSLKTQLSG